ncbi:MYND-type zinc finger-containing chromatin reader ZMYND8-like isoform X2 [Mytilus edulis]|uniref:MYND-type zinc finger-containing chromatin reader ZMYND8-like isoform X2 n=1 Tax=Mytilus edulis TaxID=6550 RepID=UPI0039EF941F
MSTCQVFGCFGYYYKGASLYKFPDPLKQKELYQTWLRILNLQDDSFTPSRHKGVCSDHFETSSYELNFMTELIGHTPRPRLKPDAVPTIFAVDQSTRVDIRYEARKRDLELIEEGRRLKMSQSSRESSASRDEPSSAKRRSMGLRKDDKAKNKDPEEEKEGKDSRPIRTRLSTGSIHMNGTTTIAVAKEIENNSKLLTKDSPCGVNNRKKKLPLIEPPNLGTPPPKKRKIGRNDGTGEDNRNDYFCWLCNKEGTVVCCELCPRVYHTRCLDLDSDLPKEWVCPECEKIMRAECVDTQSMAMSMITVDTLCSLLGFALERMKHQGSEPFMIPVDQSSVSHYSDYIFNPMDLTMIEKNIKKKMYGCTEAFLADAKWILHNCIIFNGTHHKLTASAKMIIKICKHEMAEIELCPDCYWNSCVRKNDEWFTELCRSPHSLVWAKLKGYPFWPAKVLREVEGQVDVRFFGAHDRSLLPPSQVFLLSKNIPTPAKNKKGGFDYSMQELELHIQKLEQKYGTYEYAPFRCPYDRKNVYKEGKFKVSPKKRLARLSSLKFGPSPGIKESLVKQRPKTNLTSESKITEKHTILSKTASAVRNKYNSIITTRRASGISSSVENSPVKGDTNSVESSPIKGVTNSVSIENCTDQESSTESLSAQVDPKAASDIVLKLKTRLQSKMADTDEVKKEDNSQSSVESQTVDEESSNGDNFDTKEENIQDVKSEGKVDSIAFKTRSRVDNRTKILETIQSKLNQIASDEDSELPEGTNEQKFKETKNKMENTGEENKQTKNQKEKVSADGEGIKERTDNESAKIEEKLTPTKHDYLSKLQETIKKGKENLGIIDKDDDLESESSSEEEGDEDEEDEETDDGDDDDEEGSEEESEENDVEKSEEANINENCDTESAKTSETVPDNSSETKKDIKENDKSDKIESDNKSTEIADKVVKIVDTKSKTVIEREYDTVVKDVLDEATGKITQIKEKLVSETKDYDTCLMMEVETESDTDKLVIDTDDDRALSPSPKKAVSSAKSSHMTEKTKTSTIECAPPTSKPAVSSVPKTKDVSVEPASSQTELHTDFFQNAMEISLKHKPDNELNSANKLMTKKSPDRVAPPVTVIMSPTVKSPVLSPTVKSPVSSSANTILNSNIISNVAKSTIASSASIHSNQSGAPTKTDDSRNTLITDFTQKVMGPIQTAFSDFFTEVLDQEREKIKQELSRTKEKLVELEEKKKEKTPEEQSEDNKKHWEYTQQFSELKYNFRLTCLEMKSSWESEKSRLMDEVKELMKKEKETAINDTKKKQWCASCGKEAIFYCCWNTSYCDYPCQQSHWPTHMATCMQQTKDPDANKPPVNQMIHASATSMHTNGPGGPQPPNKSPMEIEQEEFQRRQQRAEEQHHHQFNIQPNGGYMPMHTSPPGVMHNMHSRQQESPPNPRKKNVWSDQDMSNAVNAVNYGGMSINKAAKVFNVPRNKISERIPKINNPGMNPPMMPGNQPNPQLQLQYVQPPQPMSIPPSVQTFSSPPQSAQMRMPNSQPVLTNHIIFIYR